MVNISGLVDQYGVFTYKSDLIWFAIENFQNWKHRELVIHKDPIAKSYIIKLDEEIFTNKPIFTPDIFGAESSETEPEADIENRTEAEDVSEEWELEKWDDLFKRMFDMARTHSLCVVQLYDRKPYWKIFTWREITESDYDSRDNPIGCTVEWETTLKLSTEWRYHKEHLKFYDENKTNNNTTALLVPFGIGRGNEIGEYDLEAIWDLIVFIRYIILDIINNSAKSSGFYHYVYGDALKDTQKQDLINSADVAGTGRAIGAKESLLKEIRAMFPPNSQFSVEALEEVLILLSGASRLPLEFFRGERQATSMGSGFAGYIDEAKVTKKKKYVFGMFKRAIMKLVEMRWGIMIEDVEPYIEAEQEPEQYESFNMEPEEKENNKEKEEF